MPLQRFASSADVIHGSHLGYVAYMLALHPEVQDKLGDEVDRAFGENGDEMPGYTAIQE